jgi:DNA-binding CsgD family transcriptional regulator
VLGTDQQVDRGAHRSSPSMADVEGRFSASQALVGVTGEPALAEALAVCLRHRGIDAHVTESAGSYAFGTILVVNATRVDDVEGTPGVRVILIGDRPDRLAEVIETDLVPVSVDLAALSEMVRGDRRTTPMIGEREANEYAMLTPREQQVLVVLANGGSTTRIAAELGISKHTVRSHLQNAMGKLGVRNRVELIAWALRSGVLSTEASRP